MSDKLEAFKHVEVDGLVLKVAKKIKTKEEDKDGWVIDVTVADNNNNNNNNNKELTVAGNQEKAVPKKETDKSPLHGFLVYATKDHSKLHVYDLTDNKHTDELELTKRISCLAKLNVDGYFCAFSNDADDKYTRPQCLLFKLTGDGKIARENSICPYFMPVGTYVKSAVCSPDNSVFLCTSRGDVYRLSVLTKTPFDIPTLSFDNDIKARYVNCIDLNVDASLATSIVCASKNELSFVDADKGEEIVSYSMNSTKPLDSIVLLDERNTKVLCGNDGALNVCTCREKGIVATMQTIAITGEAITTHPCRVGNANHFGVANSNEFMVGTDKGSIIKLTMAENYHFETTVTSRLVDRPIDHLCVSKDGKTLFIATTEGRIIKVWDIVVDGKVAEKNAQRLIRVPHKDSSNPTIVDMLLFNM